MYYAYADISACRTFSNDCQNTDHRQQEKVKKVYTMKLKNASTFYKWIFKCLLIKFKFNNLKFHIKSFSFETVTDLIKLWQRPTEHISSYINDESEGQTKGLWLAYKEYIFRPNINVIRLRYSSSILHKYRKLFSYKVWKRISLCILETKSIID